MIVLKNIDLSRVPKEDQVEKIVEEFFDVMQSMLGLMHKEGITALEVMEGYSKHLEKIKNRPREVKE